VRRIAIGHLACVRGLAYLAARRGREAAAEFQEILGERNDRRVRPVDGLGGNLLAQVCRRAVKNYRAFFALANLAPRFFLARAGHARAFAHTSA
jgi:hypothetical protein